MEANVQNFANWIGTLEAFFAGPDDDVIVLLARTIIDGQEKTWSTTLHPPLVIQTCGFMPWMVVAIYEAGQAFGTRTPKTGVLADPHRYVLLERGR